MIRTNMEEYAFGMILLLANKFQIWGDSLLPDITIKQWFLLILTSKMNKQMPTITEIADFTGTSRQNTKKILEQLAKKKFVSIKKSKTDERALNVMLSQKTFDYFSANDKTAADNVNKLFFCISDEELNTTVKTLEKLLSFFNVQPHNREDK